MFLSSNNMGTSLLKYTYICMYIYIYIYIYICSVCVSFFYIEHEMGMLILGYRFLGLSIPLILGSYEKFVDNKS